MAQTLRQPRLTGSRESATELCSSLPSDCSQTSIRVDASHMDAASQSFSDQFITEVFDKRGAASLEVIEPTNRYADHLEDAAERHGFGPRLTIHRRH